MLESLASFAPAFLGFGLRFVSNLLELRASYQKDSDRSKNIMMKGYVETELTLVDIEERRAKINDRRFDSKSMKKMRSRLMSFIVLSFWLIPPIIFFFVWKEGIPFFSDVEKVTRSTSWFGFFSDTITTTDKEKIFGYPLSWFITIQDSYIQIIQFIFGTKTADIVNPYYQNK
jgi:hypothetical protein